MVQRDSLWNTLYSRYKDEKLTDAAWNLRQRYGKIASDRKAKSIKVIEFMTQKIPSASSIKKNQNMDMICSATTLSGKRCRFKATCGGFCKKHKI